MENVEGMLTRHRGRYVCEVVKAFIDCGYIVRLEKIYAYEYGVPQKRKRVIIIGNRLGINFRFPEPTFQLHGRIFRKAAVTLSPVLKQLDKLLILL